MTPEDAWVSPQDFIRDEVMLQIEFFGSTCVGNIVCSVDDPVKKWGLQPGEWLPMVRAVMVDMADRRQIEETNFSNAVWYKFPNILQRMANAVEDSCEQGTEEVGLRQVP